MRRPALLAALATALAVAAPALTGVAHAYVPPSGAPCSLVWTPDPTGEPGTALGTVQAGPIAAAGTTLVVTCNVQIGGTGLYTDPDNGPAVAAAGVNTVTLAPFTVAFNNGGTLPVYVCTTVEETDASGTSHAYWDDATQAWVTTTAATYCAPAPGPANPVDGGILVDHTAPGQPVVTPFGVLADPTQWTCAVPVWTAAAPFTVTCTPVSTSVPWVCQVVAGLGIVVGTGGVRVSADCDGGSPELQTTTATPTTIGWGIAAPAVPATTFACTFDDGAGLGPVPSYRAVCWDPGA